MNIILNYKQVNLRISRTRVYAQNVGRSKRRVPMTTSSRTNTFGGLGGVSFDDSHDIDEWGRISGNTREAVTRGKVDDAKF